MFQWMWFVVLGFLDYQCWNKSCCKEINVIKVLHLLNSDCSLSVQIKTQELYRHQYPWTLERLWFIQNQNTNRTWIAVAGVHLLSFTSMTPHLPSVPVGPMLLQDTKPTLETQQPPPLVPFGLPKVPLKSLPSLDVLDFLIKPTCLVQSSIHQFQ